MAKDLKFAPIEGGKSKNVEVAMSPDGTALFLKVDLTGETYRNDKGTLMRGGCYGTVGEGENSVRLSFTAFKVVKKATLAQENSALLARIAELEANAKK